MRKQDANRFNVIDDFPKYHGPSVPVLRRTAFEKTLVRILSQHTTCLLTLNLNVNFFISSNTFKRGRKSVACFEIDCFPLKFYSQLSCDSVGYNSNYYLLHRRECNCFNAQEYRLFKSWFYFRVSLSFKEVVENSLRVLQVMNGMRIFDKDKSVYYLYIYI